MGHKVLANNDLDTDRDGVPDKDELNVYFTDLNNPDTDGDGFKDGDEIVHGFSPYNSAKGARLDKSDTDKDGLSDLLEIQFKTDPRNPDTDNDAIKDGDAVKQGLNPLNSKEKLPKKIAVNLKKQEMYYFLGDIKLGTFRVSTGKRSTPTPKGNYKITNKSPKAWSKTHGLWMPDWMGLNNGKIGIHELPEWPSGKKEGANHLGTPVSHGCVRLGVGPAKQMYDWSPIGTPVTIY